MKDDGFSLIASHPALTGETDHMDLGKLMEGTILSQCVRSLVVPGKQLQKKDPSSYVRVEVNTINTQHPPFLELMELPYN